ncbi:MAG: insulinase family protein [Chloracidobacterium sp.]
MPYLRWALLLSLMLLWVGLSVGQTRRRTPPPAPPSTPPKVAPIRGIVEQVQRGELTFTRFSNGLRLICAERYASEIVGFAVRFEAGQMDEPASMPGVAWVVAYGLLSEADEAALDAAGATLDIHVGSLETTLTVTAPTAQATTVVGRLLRALSRTTFDEDHLRLGRLRAVRAQAWKLSQAASAGRSAWLSLAMGRTGLATPDAESQAARIEAVTLDAARDFYASRLRPRETILALTGEINLVQSLRAVSEAGGDWKPASEPQPPAPVSATSTGRRYQAERGAPAATFVHLGYALPVLPPEERVALEVARAALGLGRRSRLCEALVENRRIASAVTTSLDVTAKGSGLCIGLSIEPELLDRAEALTLEAVERLRRERLSEGELQRAKAQLELERWLAGDSVDGWARQLVQVEAGTGLLTWLEDLDRLESITAEQVRAAAAKHLVASRLVVHEYEAATAPPRTFTPEKFFETVGLLVPATLALELPPDAATDAPATVVVSVKARPKTKAEGLTVMPPAEPVREYATLRGPRVLVRPDPARPLVAAGLYFQGGRFIEDETNAGVTELMLRVMTRSTVKSAPDGILDEIERLGGQLRIVNERDFFGFELCVLARHAEAVLGRLIALTERPNFDPPVVTAERERLLTEQKRQTRDAYALAPWLARRSLFPVHPYGFPSLGVAGTVSKLDEAAVQRWYAATIQRQLPIVVIVGGTQGSSLVTRDVTEGFVRRETDTSLRARVAQPADAPLAQEVTTGTCDVVAFALATPGGREADARWEVLAHWLARQLKTKDIHTTVKFTPALQRGELLLVGETRPGDGPRVIETVEGVFREVARRAPSAEAWRSAGQGAATETARAIGKVTGRSRAYAVAVYLGAAPSEVDASTMSMQRTPLPTEGVWDALSIEAAGRGLVRGARLARPK